MIEGFGDLIALAGCGFEFIAEQDLHVTAMIFDESALLQRSRDDGHGGTAGAEHHGEEFLGEVEGIGLRAILGHEEPAGEALFGLMQAVTTGELPEVEGLLLHKFENAASDLRRCVEELSQVSEGDADRDTFQLDEAARGNLRGAEDMQRADYALAADEANLGGSTIADRGDDGGYAREGKIGVIGSFLRFIEDGFQREG